MISKRIKISHKQSVLFYGPPIENVSLALENMSDDEDNGDCKTNICGSTGSGRIALNLKCTTGLIPQVRVGLNL